MKSPLRTLLPLGAAGWCAAIIAAPLFRLPFVYLLFSTICHQLPDRSWHIHGEPFGLCIRCTSISLGFLAGLLLLQAPNVRRLKLAIAITGAQWLLAVLIVDSEILRVLSGVLLGAVAAPIVRVGVEEMFMRVRTANEPM